MANVWLLFIFGSVFHPTVQVNVAYQKPANQTGAWGGQTADRAVDGNKNICAQPYVQTRPRHFNETAEWWVYLQSQAWVTSITLWNTYSTTSGRMRYFTVGVQGPEQTEVLCGQHTASHPIAAGASRTYDCPLSVYGSVVHIKKIFGHPDDHTMTICEVEVEGSFISSAADLNIIRLSDKPTNQSGSTGSNYYSDKAVNLFTGGACSEIDNPVEGEPAEWWVDLLQLHTVRTITVYNTRYYHDYFRMVNFKLEVINPGQPVTQCGDDNPVVVPRSGSRTFICPPGTVGRYVRFVRTAVGVHPGDNIGEVDLCEVVITGEVYGKASTTTITTTIITTTTITSHATPPPVNTEPITLLPNTVVPTPAPITPVPVNPVPITPAPVTPEPIIQAPVSPTPITQAADSLTPLTPDKFTTTSTRIPESPKIESVRLGNPTIAWSVTGVFMIVTAASAIVNIVLGLKYRNLKDGRTQTKNDYDNNEMARNQTRTTDLEQNHNACFDPSNESGYEEMMQQNRGQQFNAYDELHL